MLTCFPSLSNLVDFMDFVDFGFIHLKNLELNAGIVCNQLCEGIKTFIRGHHPD